MNFNPHDDLDDLDDLMGEKESDSNPVNFNDPNEDEDSYFFGSSEEPSGHKVTSK